MYTGIVGIPLVLLSESGSVYTVATNSDGVVTDIAGKGKYSQG